MKETSKAMKRRWEENDAHRFPWRELFKGKGLDVGSGDDPLTCAQPFNLADGGGDNLRDFFEPGTQFDFIHGSQVLEHMENPVRALHSWIEMVKPGGHIVATVPDFNLYEHGIWPSRWNAGHRSTWSMARETSPAEIHCKLPQWLIDFPVEVVRCALIDTNYDHTLGDDVDQTLDAEKGVEAFIEFVLRKPYV